MTTRYVGKGGNDASDGLTWATRKLTLNGAEDTPVVAGDVVYVGAGAYREVLTCDVNGGAGNLIEYIADVTGAYTDGIGGDVKISASDDDAAWARTYGITATSKSYRKFVGFIVECGTEGAITCTSSHHFTFEDCQITGSYTNKPGVLVQGADQAEVIFRRCKFTMQNNSNRSLEITHSSTLSDVGHLIENCIFFTQARCIHVSRVGGVVVNACTFDHGCGTGIAIGTALAGGQTVTVKNCLFHRCSTALSGTVVGEIVENYNNFSFCDTARSNVAVGANSTAEYIAWKPLFVSKQGLRYPFNNPPHMLLPECPMARVADAGDMPTDDFYGTLRPTTNGKRSRGAVQVDDSEWGTEVTYGGSAGAIKLPDAGTWQMFVPIPPGKTGIDYINITAEVYVEGDYAGSDPSFNTKQPGAGDTSSPVTTRGAWESKGNTRFVFSPTGWFVIELVSDNSAVAGDYAVYIDKIFVEPVYL